MSETPWLGQVCCILKGKAFFFEKKKQKTFVSAVAEQRDKSFLVLFFKKGLLACGCVNLKAGCYYGSKASLARADHLIAKACQLLRPYRAARMDPAGGDADFGAEAEFEAIAELGGGVPEGDGAVDVF